MLAQPAFADPEVAAFFDALGEDERTSLLRLRKLIFDVAEQTPGVGRVQETLKWGQPAYLTPETKSGTTIRLGSPTSGSIALYAHCQTTLISDFRALFPQDFRYEGNRAIHFQIDDPLPLGRLELLITNALKYHQKERVRLAQ